MREGHDAVSCQKSCTLELCCCFHMKDLHRLWDHRTGVNLSVDPHQKRLVKQDVGMFWRMKKREKKQLWHMYRCVAHFDYGYWTRTPILVTSSTETFMCSGRRVVFWQQCRTSAGVAWIHCQTTTWLETIFLPWQRSTYSGRFLSAVCTTSKLSLPIQYMTVGRKSVARLYQKNTWHH